MENLHINNEEAAKIWDAAVEAAKKSLRSYMDHCEYGIEYKSDVNHEYLDCEKLIERIEPENPYEDNE